MYLSKIGNSETNQYQTDFKSIIKERLTNLNKKIINLKKESQTSINFSQLKNKKKNLIVEIQDIENLLTM